MYRRGDGKKRWDGMGWGGVVACRRGRTESEKVKNSACQGRWGEVAASARNTRKRRLGGVGVGWVGRVLVVGEFVELGGRSPSARFVRARASILLATISPTRARCAQPGKSARRTSLPPWRAVATCWLLILF